MLVCDDVDVDGGWWTDIGGVERKWLTWVTTSQSRHAWIAVRIIVNIEMPPQKDGIIGCPDFSLSRLSQANACWLTEVVRAHLRPGTYHVLVLMELQWICRMGAQGDRSLLNALSRKCYMHTLQYVHRGALPWAENEKKAVFSFYPSPTIYNRRVTRRAGAEQARCGYPLSSMKMHQANAAYGEKDK